MIAHADAITPRTADVTLPIEWARVSADTARAVALRVLIAATLIEDWEAGGVTENPDKEILVVRCHRKG